MSLENLHVIHVDANYIQFSNGVTLRSYHYQNCCENHYLDFSTLTSTEFDGLLFNLTNDDFFIRVPNYGIRLVPINGHPVSIPGYSDNNGYYSDNLSLEIVQNSEVIKSYDITECQPET